MTAADQPTTEPRCGASLGERFHSDDCPRVCDRDTVHAARTCRCRCGITMPAPAPQPAADTEHDWVSQDEDGVSTDCARCGIWFGKTHEGHRCPGAPQNQDGERRAARARRVRAADTEKRSDCGNPEPHEPHNFRNGGPEDGDYCHGLLDPHEETPGTPVALLLAQPFHGSSDRHQRAMVVLADEVQRLRALIPAADTETEVQWGVRRPDGTGYKSKSRGRAVENIAGRGNGTLVRRTATTAYTPWEEA